MQTPSCGQVSWGLELLKGLPVFIIGLIATYIAWRQHETAKAKLKMDLFDKRYAIFERTWRFLSDIARTEEPKGLLSDFSNLIPQAGFLFGPAVSEYLEEVSSRNTKLWSIDDRARKNGNVVEPDDVDARLELMEWFAVQAVRGAKSVFEPFLNFEKWR
ncbi:MAG: hypothetical protein M0Z85_03105 [Gammaproteobacteria bacterium]|nr:hypothetical protein [Gammaproteobacteria bacterium]